MMTNLPKISLTPKKKLPTLAAGLICITFVLTAPTLQGQAPSPSAPEAATEDPRSPRGFDDLESGRELVNMDFPELTNIKDIIKAISLWTGKNVILDQNVNGKIQIISPRPVTKVEAYEAFKSALNVLNLTPVETGKFIKILPIRSALKDNLKTYYGSSFSPSTDQVITQVIPLKFVDAKTVRTMLSKLVPASSLIAYEPTNTLIVSESGFKVNRVLEIIKYLDVETEQSQVAIVPIIYSDAKHIASQIKQIFTGSLTGSRKSSYHTYKIFPDSKTNSVVIFGPPRTIKDVRDLVKKFDIKVEDVSRQATIHVRPLDYANAKKLAATLNALTSGSKTDTSSRFPTLSRLRRAASSKNNDKSNTSSTASVADLGSGVKITADESSNSLLITGSRSAYNAINAIVRKMDVKKSQVFIEADILDIGLQKASKFGSSIFAGTSLGNDALGLGSWEGSAVAPLVTAGLATDSEEGAASTLQGLAGTFGSDFTFGIMAGEGIEVPGLGTISPAALIKMIKTDSNTRVLSSPHILISNNEEGAFSSGQKIFYETSTVNPSTGTPVPRIDKEDVELELIITPNISHSNFVTMTIDLSADTPGKDSETGLPQISTRKTKQSLTVKNAQTVVISGLVETREAEVFQKIPLLGDIPIIGWLFRNSRLENQKSNLVIFITAHIIHGPNDLANIYQDKLEERDEMLDYWRRDFIGNIQDDEFYAKLPTPEDGAYKPTDIDQLEERRLLELRQQLLEDMGYTEPIIDQEPVGAREEVITTVPLLPESSPESPALVEEYESATMPENPEFTPTPDPEKEADEAQENNASESSSDNE